MTCRIPTEGSTHARRPQAPRALAAIGRGDPRPVALLLGVVTMAAVRRKVDVERAAIAAGVERDPRRVLRRRDPARVLVPALEVDAGQGAHARPGVVREPLGEVEREARVQRECATGTELGSGTGSVRFLPRRRISMRATELCN